MTCKSRRRNRQGNRDSPSGSLLLAMLIPTAISQPASSVPEDHARRLPRFYRDTGDSGACEKCYLTQRRVSRYNFWDTLERNLRGKTGGKRPKKLHFRVALSTMSRVRWPRSDVVASPDSLMSLIECSAITRGVVTWGGSYEVRQAGGNVPV